MIINVIHKKGIINKQCYEQLKAMYRKLGKEGYSETGLLMPREFREMYIKEFYKKEKDESPKNWK